MQVCLYNPEVYQEIKSLIMEAESVIMYRSSPAQKAEMVNMVKKEAKGQKTMAIGDGANDVNMIINAHIGVGILSKEGNAAAAFGDYAMPDFQCLRRLLFWHGRPFMIRL